MRMTNKDTICKLTRSDNTAYNLEISFEFGDGGNPTVFGPKKIFQNDRISQKERLVELAFFSEDGGDHDNNDTILTITSVAFDPTVESRIEEPPAS